MKYGIREVCNVAFKAKADNTKIGSRTFKKGELVMYFDTAKTSTLEGSAEAVYARGGRGNPKLITWEGEKTMTFTFEEALLSPMGMSILMSADLTTAEKYLHGVRIKTRAYKDEGDSSKKKLDINDEIHEMFGSSAKLIDPSALENDEQAKTATLFVYSLGKSGDMTAPVEEVTFSEKEASSTGNVLTSTNFQEGDYYIVDGYVQAPGSNLIITADKFSDYFYIEAETLFRGEDDGIDKPAQFTIPKAKVASNFNLSMANNGDPSTFTFTVDAMADYTLDNKKKKVLCAINVLG